MKTKEEQFSGIKLSGIGMTIFNFLLLLASLFIIAGLNNETLGVLMMVIDIILWRGLILLEPNEAMVLLFMGKYKGTVKDNGFFWINPLLTKKKLTLRASNLDAEPIKVNDKVGNPVMIGIVAVWRIADTYKASFNIDNSAQARGSVKMKVYQNFVQIQCDAALRNVAGLYSYDHSGNETEGASLTLRSGGEEINSILEQQINERLAIAGIEVIEARINYLAYAPEIAAIMLRRQQADAIISAREKIVDGAVSMVKLALDKMKNEGIVDLDEERKAAMVSNLLVVLCGDESAQPVVNAGTLY